MSDSDDPNIRLSGYVRDPADLSRSFHAFARLEAPQINSAMYTELSYGVSLDAELIELAAQTRVGQPPPNMLFAAVQYLLLSGVEHELVEHYPAISGKPRPLSPAFPAFRDFCLQHRDDIIRLEQTRLTQTNVVLRSACLLPAFAYVYNEAAAPLALVEVGPSAGLNMNWDRYAYEYVDIAENVALRWGDPDSPVTLRTALRGTRKPLLADHIDVASRIGVDLNPIDIDDEDQVRWLRSLIWPEHIERHARLLSAVEIARQFPTERIRGDALELIPQLLAQIPPDAAIVVYATYALYQMTREQRVALLKQLQAFANAEGRRVDLISLEGTQPDYSPLMLHTYDPKGRRDRELARANPHGHWLEWLS